jgi:hypothetical protein
MRVSFWVSDGYDYATDEARQRKKEFTQQFAAALTTRNGAILDACAHPKSNQHRAERVPGNLEMRLTGGRISTFVPGAERSEPSPE